MSAQSVMDEFEAAQGWNESTRLALLIEYIDNQSDDGGLREFLRYAAEEIS